MIVILNRDKLRHSLYGDYEISEEDVTVRKGYDIVASEFLTGMKPVGRVYFDQWENLNYTDGAPVPKAIIDGGEKGVIEKYLRAGKRVYTEEQVIDIINSRCYEINDELKPKITPEIEMFLKEISNNKAKDKPKRAKELLENYQVIGKEKVTGGNR